MTAPVMVTARRWSEHWRENITDRRRIPEAKRCPEGYARGLLAALSLLASGCVPADTNFSQYPGFAEYFAANPPSSTLPDAEAHALLEQYRPRFLLPEDHPGLIDFYADYVAEGTLINGDGKPVSSRVSPAELNAWKSDPKAEFRHRAAAGRSPAPVVFGRVDRARVQVETATSEHQLPLVFLTYHAVFRHSGLPAALPAWKAFFLGITGDLNDWHQLDHYTAVTVVLDEFEVPLAVMIQQHNYLHTRLIGEGIELPADNRVRIDVAIRSNELYPHARGRQARRAVRFATPEGMAYLLGFGGRPFLSADDVTDSAKEAEYRLGFLPHDDAFYMFLGFLGERRLLPGRSGPPGAAFNTLPALKPLGRQLFFGYWREGNAGDWGRYRAAVLAGNGPLGFAKAQSSVFLANWRCLRRRAGCELE